MNERPAHGSGSVSKYFSFSFTSSSLHLQYSQKIRDQTLALHLHFHLELFHLPGMLRSRSDRSSNHGRSTVSYENVLSSYDGLSSPIQGGRGHCVFPMRTGGESGLFWSKKCRFHRGPGPACALCWMRLRFAVSSLWFKAVISSAEQVIWTPRMLSE
jgi:hypothetical protein